MDPNVTALLVGATGIVGTLAGVVIADRLGARRDKTSRLRERRLLALQQTKQLIHAHLTDALQVAAGGASGRLYGSDVYPLADTRLVGDVEAIGQYLRVAVELFKRPAGEPVRESHGRAVADVFVAVDAAIARQEALAVDDKAQRVCWVSRRPDRSGLGYHQSMAGFAFEAFMYPGDEQPSGEIQVTVSPGTRALIDGLRSQVREFIPVGYHGDCVWETSEWCRQLREQVRVERVGGDGIDDSPVGSDYLKVPPSGYREADGEVHRHWWLLIEEREHVFDPTVHRQFDDKGGFSQDHYVLDGIAQLRRPCPGGRSGAPFGR